MAKHGGARPKAGRITGIPNKKTIEQKEARAYLQERIREEFDPIIDVLLKKAQGETIKEIRKEPTRDGKKIKEIVIYHEPDNKMIEFALTMVTGKPKEELDIKSNDLKEMGAALRKMIGEK